MVKSSPQLVNEGSSSFLRAARAGNLEKVVEYLNGSLDINTANMNGMNALHLASKEGHTDMVKELLKRGANVNAGTNKGNTALHIASLGGKLQVVEILVDNGANVNAKSLNGFTPLYMAAQENHDTVVRYLLAHGANQSIATEDGFTPLAVALQQGHDKVVSILLENDAKGKVRLPALHIAAKKDDCKAAALLLQSDQKPDVTSKSGFTPLHIAAHYGNESIATLLLDKGANINFTAKHKITPLHVAAKWGKGNMVGLLLDRGAQIDAATRDGLTPLHCAARSGHEPVVDLLLRRGAPYSAKTKNGLAPLHMASQGDHIDSARTLLAYKAPVDDVTVDYLTPLHVAAHCGHVKVAKLLLDHKADVNAQALNGFVPLHIACKKNRLKVVELLLKHGASIEVKTESGLTPLHVASFMGCTNIVLFLIQHGANVNKSTIRGETPIHLAARAGQAEIIPILVRNGAQVDARAREDQTALHIASRLGDVEIVQLLLSRGASIDAATKDQYTALHIAAKEGKENVADALLEQGASLTATTKKGFTPLHLAAKYGQFKVARLLLEKDAPVDAQGKNGVTPLHVAAHYDHVQVALLLLEKKASPHATAKNGYTPLHIAAKKKQMDIATTLLEYGAKANAESKAGFTPLHLAAQEGHTDMGELLISHKANVNAKSKLELTPLHLSAQSDKVAVAQVLLRNRADVNAQTKQGYTPLHVACHNGAINMIKLLIQAGANVDVTTQHGYTPLHQAAQQGHTLVINLLLDHKASPNKTTNLGYTPLAIAQKCNYISVVETLKTVTEVTTTSIITTTTGEKYSYNNPETMQETFMTTDSEDEGGEGADNWAKVNLNYEKNDGNEYSKHDESFGFDVTHDESGSRAGDLSSHAPLTVDESISPSHIIMQESIINNFTPDNIDISRPPTSVGRLKWKTFLVSFMVDARGGAMRGCRHSGVRIIIPPRKAPMPMRITCRYLKKEKLIHPPPLMEGEACASRILEVGPSGAKFLGPVIIEVPHFASMRGREREIIILRSDDGENWKEHTLEASEEAVRGILNESFQGDSDLNALEPEFASDRITRILTTDFPQYFAIITRIRQEVNAMGPEGGMVNSSVVPQVQAIFPAGALTKKIKVGLQAQPIASELVAKMLGNRVAVSPIVTVEPRRRKFHKPITLTIPVPQAATRGMINSYTGDTPTLRLLCSITGSTKSGGTSKAQWEDVTGSTPLSFVNNCVSFTTTVSARFWLMDCRQVNEATKFATDLYREATAVPFMSKFVVFAKRHDPAEAQMRIFCMTDDKEDKTLEHQEQFTETAKSRDVEVLEGKPQYLEFAGNLVPVTKSGEQLNLTFNAFRENRLPFLIRVRDSSQEPFGKIAFMKEPRKTRGEPPQVPICNLNIKLPDTIVEEEPVNNHNDVQIIRETIQRSAIDDDIILNADPSIMQMGQDLAKDWIKVASHLDFDHGDTEKIKKQFANQESEQATAMLYSINLKKSLFSNKDLCKALWDIGRKDLVTKYYPNHSQYLAEFGIKLNGKLDDANEIIKSSKGLPTEREVAFDDKDIMKDAESMEESEGESVGVNIPTAAANNKVSIQEARGQEDEERETAVKQYLKYLEDEDREDSEERAAYRGEKSTPNELYIIKEEIQVPTGDPVIDTTDGDKSSIPEPTYEAESQIKTEEKVEFTDEGGLTHSITQVTKTTIIQEVEDPIQASVQHRLQQQQPQSQQQQQLLESGKPYESETWQSGEQDTSQVSVSSLPEDEKSEPTTATVSSATTTTTNASENAVSSRIASVTEEPGTKITVEQNGNSDKEEYQLIAESILRQVYDEVFELIRTKKITIDDKEWFETEASGDVVHIIEQSTTCERNEDKSVKEESDHEMSYTEKKDYFAKLSHDSTVKPVPSTPHYYRSSSIETSGMNKSETRRPSEGEIVETVGGFQERRAYFESTGRRSFSIDTASMDEARTAYNSCLVQRSSQHPDSGLKEEEDEQDDNIKGNLNLLHDYGGNLGCNVSHVDGKIDEFNERASNLHYMSKDELYEALNQLEAEIELAQSDLDRVDKENDEEIMSQSTLESIANQVAPNCLKMNDELDISASTLHQLSTEEPHSSLVNDNDDGRENRSSSALGSSSMRLIVRNRTDVSVKDFPVNEVDVETGEIARLLVRPISRSTVETTDPETSNESVVYKVWKGLDPVERCPSPLRQQFSRALRDIEPFTDPDDCVSGKSSNPDMIKDDKVTTLNQQIAIVQPIYLSNWKSMKNILTDEGLDLISQAIEIALIQIPSETGYPKYYYVGRELIKSLVEASLERVLFYAIEMVRIDCVESGLINLTSPSIPGLSSVPIPYWLPHTHDSSTFPNPNNITKDTWFRLVDVRSVATQTTFRTNQISRWIQTNVSYLNPSWNGCESIHRFGSPGVDSVQSGGIEWTGKGSGRRRPSISTFRDSIDDDSFPMSIDYRLSSWAADRATQTTSEGDLFSEEYFDVDDMDVDSLKSELGSVYGEESSDEMSSSERQRYEDLIAANEAIETGLMALVAGELALLTAEIANDEVNDEANESDSSSVPPCILYKGNDIPWLDDEGWDSDEQRYTCNGKPNSLSIRRDSRSHGSDTSNDCLDNRLSDDDGEKENANKSDVRDYKLFEKQLVKRTVRSASKRSSSSEGSVSSIGSQTCEHEFEAMPKYLETDLDSVEIIEGKISLTGQQGSSAFTKVKSIDKDSYSNDLLNIDQPHLTEEPVNDEYEDKYLWQDSISGYLENEDDEDDLVYELGTILNSENAVPNTYFNCDKISEPPISSSVDFVQEDFMNAELENCEESTENTKLKITENDVINESSETLSQDVIKGPDLVRKYDIQTANESDNEETESQSEYESAYLDDDREQQDFDDEVGLDINEEIEQRNSNVFQYPSYIIAESSVSYIGDSSDDIPPSEEQNYNWILSQYGSPSVQKRFEVPSIKPESSNNPVNEADSFDSMTSSEEEMEQKQKIESPESFYEQSSSNSSLEQDNNQISDHSSVLTETPKKFDKFAQEFASLQEYDENNNLILNEQETANAMQENASYGQNFEVLNSNEESIRRAELNEDLNFEELDAEISQMVSSYDCYGEKGIEQNLVDSDWYDYDQEQRYRQNRLDLDYEMEADSPSRYRDSYLRKQSSEDIEPDYEEYMNEIEMKNETATYANQVLGAIKNKIATLLNRPVILNDDQVDDMSDSSSTQLDENNNVIDENELMEKISPSFETLPKMESKDNLEKKLELEPITRKDLIDISNENYPQTVECLMMNSEEVESSSSKAIAKSDFVDMNIEDSKYDRIEESKIESVQIYENASQDLSKSPDYSSYELQEQEQSKEIVNISSELDNEMVRSIESDSSAIDSGLMSSPNTSIFNTESLPVDLNSVQSNMSNLATETDVNCSSFNELSKCIDIDNPENETLRHENTPELDVDSCKLPHVTYDEVVSARKDSSESVTADGLGPSGSEYDTATTDQSSSSYKTAIPFSSDENSFATIQSSSSLESINSIESDKSVIQTEFNPSSLEMRIENNADNLSNDELYDELPIEVMKDSLQYDVSTLHPLADELIEGSDDDIYNEYDELTYLADEMLKDETEEANCVLSEADRLKARLLEILNRPTVLPESRLEGNESPELSDSVSDQVSLSQGIEEEYENEPLFSEKVSLQDNFDASDEVQVVSKNDNKIELDELYALDAVGSELSIDQVDISQAIESTIKRNEDSASTIIESIENLKEQISVVESISSIEDSASKLTASENLKGQNSVSETVSPSNETAESPCVNETPSSSIDAAVSQAIESTVYQNEDSASTIIESSENLKEQVSVVDTVSPCNELSSISVSPNTNEMLLLSSDDVQIVSENDNKIETADESNAIASELPIDQVDFSQAIESIVHKNEDPASILTESNENLKGQLSIDTVSPCNETASQSESPSTNIMLSSSDVEQSFSEIVRIDAVSPCNELSSISKSAKSNEIQMVRENDDKNETVDESNAERDSQSSIDQVDVNQAIEFTSMIESGNLGQIYTIDAVSQSNELDAMSESQRIKEMPLLQSDEVQIVGENDKNEIDELNALKAIEDELSIDKADVNQVIESIIKRNDDSTSTIIESSENLKEQASVVDTVSPCNELSSISESPNTNEMLSSEEVKIVSKNDNKNEIVEELNALNAIARELSIDQVDFSQSIESISSIEDSASKSTASENLKGQISVIATASSCNETAESPCINETPSSSIDKVQNAEENDIMNETVIESNPLDVSDLSIDKIDVNKAIELIVHQNEDSLPTMVKVTGNLNEQISIIDVVSPCNESGSILESPLTNEMMGVLSSSDVETVQLFPEIEQKETSETAEHVQNEVENVSSVEKAEIDAQKSILAEPCEALEANVSEDLLSSVKEPNIECENELFEPSELDDTEETINLESSKLDSVTIEESPIVIDIDELDMSEQNSAINAEVLSEIDYLTKAVPSFEVVQEKNENQSVDELKASCINDEKVSESEIEKFEEKDKEKVDISSASNFAVQLELEPQISEPFYPEQSINFETIAQPNLISEFKICPKNEIIETTGTIELTDITTDESNLDFIQIVKSVQQKVDEIQGTDEKCEKQKTIEDSLSPNDDMKVSKAKLSDANSLINNENENELIESSTERKAEKLIDKTYDQARKSQNESYSIEKDVEEISKNAFENESELKTEAKYDSSPKMSLQEDTVTHSRNESQQLKSEPVQVLSSSSQMGDEGKLTESQMIPSEVIIFKLQDIESEETNIKDLGDQVILEQEDQMKPLQMSVKTELLEPQNPIKIECHLENFEETIDRDINSIVNTESESISVELSQLDEITTVNVGKELNSAELNLSLSSDADKSTFVQTNEQQNLKKDEKQSDSRAKSPDIVNKPEEINLMNEKKVNESVSEQSVDGPKKPERKKKITKPKIEIAQSSGQEELLSPILDADHEAEIIKNTFKDEIKRNQMHSMKNKEEVKDEFESQPIENKFTDITGREAKKMDTDADTKPNNRDLSVKKDENIKTDSSPVCQKDVEVKLPEKQVDDSSIAKVEKLKDSIEDIKVPKVEPFVDAESKIAREKKNKDTNERVSDDSEVKRDSKQKLEASKSVEDSKVNEKKDSTTKDKESARKITVNNESIKTLDSMLFKDVELRSSLDINESKNINKFEIIESNLAKPSQLKVTFVESRVRSDLFEQPSETTEKLTTDNGEKSVLDKVEVQRSSLIDSVHIEIEPTILIKDIKIEEAKLLENESPNAEISDSQVDSCATNLDSLELHQNINENKVNEVNSAYDEIIQNKCDEDSTANAKGKASLHEKTVETITKLSEAPLICMKEPKVLPENKASANCVDALKLESTVALAPFKPNTEIPSSSTQQKSDLYNCISTCVDVKQCPKKVELENDDQIKKQTDEPLDDSSKVVQQNKLNEKIEPESKMKPKSKKDGNGEKVSKLDEITKESNRNAKTSSEDLIQHEDKIESDKIEPKVESKSKKLEQSDSIATKKDRDGSIHDKLGKGKDSKLKDDKCSNLVESVDENVGNKSSIADQSDSSEGKHSEKILEKVDKLSVKRKSSVAKPDLDKLVSVQLEIPFIGGALTWKMPVSVPSDKRRKSSSLKKDEDAETGNAVTVKRKSSKELTNNSDVDTVFNLNTKSKLYKQETEASTEATIKTKVDHQVDSTLKSSPSIESDVNIVANAEKLNNKSQSESEKKNTLIESVDCEVDEANANQSSINKDKLKSPSPPSSPTLSTLKTEGKSKNKRKIVTKRGVKDCNVKANDQMIDEKIKSTEEVDASIIKSPTNTIRDTIKDSAFESRITDKPVDHLMQFDRESLVNSTPKVEPNQSDSFSNRSRRDLIPPMSPNRRERSLTGSVRRSLSRSRDRPNIPIASKGYTQMNERITPVESKSASIRPRYSEKSNESLRLFTESRMPEDRLSRFDSYKLHLPSSRSYLNLRRSYESLNDIYHRTIDAVEDDYLRVKRTHNSINSTSNQFNSYNRINDEMKYKSNYSTRFNDYHSYIDHNRLVKSLDYSSHRRKKIAPSQFDYRRRQFNSDYSISTDYTSLFNSIRDRINQLKSDSRKRFRQIEYDYIYHSCPDITQLCSNQSFKRPSSSLSHKIRRRQSPEKLVSQSLEVNRYRSRPSDESSLIRRTSSSFNINGQSERIKTSGSTIRHNYECKLSNYTPHYTSVQDLNYYTRRTEPKAQLDKSKIYTDYLGPWFSNNNSISNHNLSNYRPSRSTYSQSTQPSRRRESSSPPSFSSTDYNYCFKSKVNFDDYHSSRNLIYGNEDIYSRQSNKSTSIVDFKREVSSTIKYHDCNERLNNLTVSRSFLDLTNSSSHLSNDLERKLVRARSNWARTQSTIKVSNHDKPLKSFSSNESQTLKKFIRRK